ncbi:tRNA(Ile)-lysidine synthase [Corynebacterium deserti GIMN1.010]|uniref:tRNA(Ile)-lysidine synthase n=1 Tax=Corynebacterium deserti GIMN1.010 TaxID=931089 RepID=A0A0M4CRL9_9CORY|nr:tRNA lysidine(34) synthetase TilS [Corynebacterium deserti]ALC06792.1 tRNA(Ile)-lysidine synthase [Corynebacterium deserti GIMN1.010]
MPSHIGELSLPRISPNFVEIRNAIRPYLHDHVFIGLSGGADSLALVAAAAAEGVEVTAVCIDHNLQDGSAAVTDQAAAMARMMGAHAITHQVHIAPGQNMEAAARTARYDAFAQSTDEIWVAHTMDDQAETYLLGGLRGNPAGMKDASRRPPLTIIRPLLGVRRAHTHGACTELGLKPWHDPHNTDDAFRRVAIRSQVIPLLNEITGGDSVPGLALAARRAVDDAEVVDGAVEKRRALWQDGFPVELASEPTGLRRRMLADFLRGHGIAVSSRKIEAVDRLLTDWHGQGGVAVGKSDTGRLEVVRRSGKLKVTD